MDRCRWLKRVERWFDGESADAQAVERHVAACSICADHVRCLRALRDGTAAVAVPETINDLQFPAFLTDIHERIGQPRRSHRGFWALASAATAALIVAAAAFTLMTGGPQAVHAVEVESYATELEGASVCTYHTDNGTATVWVSMPKEESL